MKTAKIILALLAMHTLTACYTAAVAGAGAAGGYIYSEEKDKDDGDLD